MVAESRIVAAPFSDQSAMISERGRYPNPLCSCLRQIYTYGNWFAASFIWQLLPIIEEVTKDMYGLHIFCIRDGVYISDPNTMLCSTTWAESRFIKQASRHINVISADSLQVPPTCV
jgi:hypothetical protein